MAFSDTWDPTFEAIPADAEGAKLGAQRIRELKVAIRERLSVNPALWDGTTQFLAAGTGAVVRTQQDKSRDIVSVRDFSAVGDGTADDTVAIQTAIDTLHARGGTVYFPPGIYKVTGTILVNSSRINLIGAGRYATEILFAPTAGTTCIKVDGSGSIVNQGRISDMALFSNDSTFTKTGIELIDVSAYAVENITIGGSVPVAGTSFWSGGAGSIGIRTAGREASAIARIDCAADRPIVVAQNPNASIHIDHFHFSDLYLIANGAAGGNCFEISDGVNLTNVTIDGYNAFVGGRYGLIWADTTSAQISSNLHMSGIRTEQGTDAAAYSISIRHNFGLYHVTLKDSYLDSGRNGVIWKNIYNLKIENTGFPSGTRVALNGDVGGLTAAFLELDQFDSSVGSSRTLTGYTERWSVRASPSGDPKVALYSYDVGNITMSTSQNGVSEKRFKGTLGNGASFDMQIGTGGGASLAEFSVSAHGATKHTGGIAIVDSVQDTLISGHADFAIGNTPAKFCVFKSGVTTALVNNLGESVDYMVTAKFRV